MQKIVVNEQDIGFQCCFCAEGVELNSSNGCIINIIINIDRSEDLQASQDFFCHTTCFKTKLFSLNYFLPGKIIDIVDLIKLNCCFCDEKVTSNKIDPCDITVKITIDATHNKYLYQNFLCHSECFKATLVKNVHFYLQYVVRDDE